MSSATLHFIGLAWLAWPASSGVPAKFSNLSVSVLNQALGTSRRRPKHACRETGVQQVASRSKKYE